MAKAIILRLLAKFWQDTFIQLLEISNFLGDYNNCVKQKDCKDTLQLMN
jgi:hypothetical protein